MTIRILLQASKFENCSVVGTTQFDCSAFPLFYVEQTDSNGYIPSPPLELAVFSDLQTFSDYISLLGIGCSDQSKINFYLFNVDAPYFIFDFEYCDNLMCRYSIYA